MHKQSFALWALLASLASANAQTICDTAPSYQGYLTDAGVPLNGTYDFILTYYDQPTGGSQLGDPITNSAVSVVDGLFIMRASVAGLCYSSSGVFSGLPPCVEIAVRTNGSTGDFLVLSPRQQITPAPYAYRAQVADQYNGPIGTNQLAGTYPNALALVNPVNQFAGNGSGLIALNASSLTSGMVPEALIPDLYWKFLGNSNTTPATHFLGTTDNQPLELKVNNGRALRLEPNASEAPNVIGGARYNSVGASVVGATIAGGGAANYTGSIYTNKILANFGTIGGGSRHTIQPGANSAVVAGGYHNEAGTNANSAAIGGGRDNSIGTDSTDAVVAGGRNNVIESGAVGATISGGQGNSVAINADYATIPGGRNARATAYGEWAYASGSLANPGDAQASLFVARNITSNATPTSLFLDGQAAEIPVATKETMAFDILVTARSTTGNSAAYHIRGVIAGQPGGTVGFVGTPLKTVLGEAVPGWDVDVEASSMTLKIKATGSVSEAIAWSARIGATKMIWPMP